MTSDNGWSAIGILITLVFMFCAVYGYIANIVKLTKCDFASPYKAEVIRGAGVIVPPAGVIIGFCNIKD